MDNQEKKTVELWDGYVVEVNVQLFDDVDFIKDFTAAVNSSDISELLVMYMAIIGGEDTYQDIRKHIESEKGYFSQSELKKITDKIDDLFPKAGNRAQRRSWKNSL